MSWNFSTDSGDAAQSRHAPVGSPARYQFHQFEEIFNQLRERFQLGKQVITTSGINIFKENS